MFKNEKKKSKKDKDFYECGPGLVVILAQDGRMGNDMDIDAINSLFLDMGHFDVHKVPQDMFLTSKVPQIMEEIRDKIEHGYRKAMNDPGTDYTSLSVFVLSHGGTNEHGVEYFEDSHKNKIVFTQFVANFYNGFLSQKFLGRPRLFFMQTCRGKDVNHLLELPLSCETSRRKRTVSEDSLEHDGHSSQEFKRAKTEEGSSSTTNTSSNSSSKKQLQGNPRVPHVDDLFIIKATVEGTRTYKKERTGSFFIQSVCDVLRDKPHIEFYDLVRGIRISMESKANHIGVDKGGLVPEVHFTPKKKFRFVKKAKETVVDAWGQMDLAEVNEQDLVDTQPIEEPEEQASQMDIDDSEAKEDIAPSVELQTSAVLDGPL